MKLIMCMIARSRARPGLAMSTPPDDEGNWFADG